MCVWGGWLSASNSPSYSEVSDDQWALLQNAQFGVLRDSCCLAVFFNMQRKPSRQFAARSLTPEHIACVSTAYADYKACKTNELLQDEEQQASLTFMGPPNTDGPSLLPGVGGRGSDQLVFEVLGHHGDPRRCVVSLLAVLDFPEGEGHGDFEIWGHRSRVSL
mgnify:CR=1 FL=1